MQPNLFIDGYNLMHAAGLARQTYGPGDLERARDRLLAQLKNLLDLAERRKTVVVFDAKESPGFLGSRITRHELTVVFPDRGVEADSVLEQLIREHTAPTRLKVVSSDHRIQVAAKRRKALPIDSDRFLARLEHRDTIDRTPEKPSPGAISPDELAHWENELEGLI